MSRERLNDNRKVDRLVDPKPYSPRRIEVITGADTRRRSSEETKARIVAESFAEGAVVAQVARRRGRDAGEGFRSRPRTTPAPEPVVRFETVPGRQMQADWATVGRGAGRLCVFATTLGWSRAAYVEFCSDERIETLVRCAAGSSDEGVFANIGAPLPEKLPLLQKGGGAMDEFGEDLTFEVTTHFFGRRLDDFEGIPLQMTQFRKPPATGRSFFGKRLGRG
ncbi:MULTISPECIES: transposase [Rhodomicrobium]|uniref:transposase n=1 Tax=Rhodomicrobium vannielii TaxID=1069 RepID=UPI000B4ACDC5